jgi:hypothetical protein
LDQHGWDIGLDSCATSRYLTAMLMRNRGVVGFVEPWLPSKAKT